MNEQKNLFSAECLDCTETADLRPSEITDTGRACPGITKSTEQSQVLEEGGLTNALFFFFTKHRTRRKSNSETIKEHTFKGEKERGRKEATFHFLLHQRVLKSKPSQQQQQQQHTKGRNARVITVTDNEINLCEGRIGFTMAEE